MLKRFLKKVARKTIHLMRDWSEEEEPTMAGPYDGWAQPYTLNPVFVEVNRTPGCDHPNTWGVVHATNLAAKLGVPRISIIEFGVAGGRSLLALENIAAKVESIFDVKIDLYGFDTGTGLSKPLNYADMPNLWSEGAFPMDFHRLKQRLGRAQLVLGPVGETIIDFIKGELSPVAFISFDVDLYSSTRDALKIFDTDRQSLLPRVYCVFDDILGYTFGDHVGERLAIAEFNASHDDVKLSPIYGLHHYVPRQFANRVWKKNYMAHVFDHPMYGAYDGSIPHEQQRALLSI